MDSAKSVVDNVTGAVTTFMEKKLCSLSQMTS